MKQLRNHPMVAGALLAVILISTTAALFGPNIRYFPSISVQFTNYVGEEVVTNGVTLGGVRNTSWPSSSGPAGGALSGNYPNPQVASGANTTNLNLITPTVGVAKGTSVALTNGLTAATVTGTNSGTFGSATINTNLTVGGQAGFTGVTTANLPTGVAPGYQIYDTDCLTPVGTGDRVEWDGSVWRTMRLRITATTDPATYLLSILGQGIPIITSPITTEYYLADNLGTFGVFPRQSISANGGVNLSFNNINSWGCYATFATGATTNGGSINRGAQINAPVSGGYYFASGNYELSALPDGTDNYWMFFGFDQASSISTVSSCVGFLYDKYNALGRGSPGVETNHWICITGRSSSFTVFDSGLTPSIVLTAPDRLAVFFTTTNAVFYTNSVACSTNSVSSTIPNVALYPKSVISKTLGTTSRTVAEGRPSSHVRLVSGPTFP